MSVVDVQPYMHLGQTGSRDGHITYRTQWHVRTGSKWDGPTTVRVQGEAFSPIALPISGYDYYRWYDYSTPASPVLEEYDEYAFADAVPSIKLKSQENNLKLWLVDINYSTLPAARNTGSRFTNPLSEPWEFEDDADELVDEDPEYDINGNPILNSAGEHVDIGTRIDFRGRFTLAKNFAVYNGNLVDAHRGSLNQYTMQILGKSFSPRQLRMRRLRVVRRYSAQVGYYYPHTFEIEVMNRPPYTHDVVWFDKGFSVLLGSGVDDDGKPATERIVDTATQQPVEEPVYLDGSGQRLAANTQPITKTTQLALPQSWAVWGFPTS